jgi:hypothetical protein
LWSEKVEQNLKSAVVLWRAFSVDDLDRFLP